MQKHKEKEEEEEGKRKVVSEASGDSEERGSKRKKEEVSEGKRLLQTEESQKSNLNIHEYTPILRMRWPTITMINNHICA